MLGLLLDAQYLAVCVELHDAEALGVRHIVAEHGAAALVLGVGDSSLQNLGEAVAVEDVVAQDHCAAVVADELFTEDESLSQAVRGRLDLILQMDAVLATIAQQRLEAGRVGRGRDDEDVLDARQHEGGQRIIDHRLVVDGQQLFAGDHRQRIEPGAGTAGQNDTFHFVHSLYYEIKKLCSLYKAWQRIRRVLYGFKAELRPL